MRSVAALVAVLALACASHAVVVRWTGAVSDDWLDPANWSPSQIPGGTDICLFGSSDSLRLARVSAPAACSELQLVAKPESGYDHAAIVILRDGAVLDVVGAVSVAASNALLLESGSELRAASVDNSGLIWGGNATIRLHNASAGYLTQLGDGRLVIGWTVLDPARNGAAAPTLQLLGSFDSGADRALCLGEYSTPLTCDPRIPPAGTSSLWIETSDSWLGQLSVSHNARLGEGQLRLATQSFPPGDLITFAAAEGQAYCAQQIEFFFPTRVVCPLSACVWDCLSTCANTNMTVQECCQAAGDPWWGCTMSPHTCNAACGCDQCSEPPIAGCGSTTMSCSPMPDPAGCGNYGSGGFGVLVTFSNGDCSYEGTVSCPTGWSGADCSTPDCPGTPDCSDRGDCLSTTLPPSCDCHGDADAGWTGSDCSIAYCPLADLANPASECGGSRGTCSDADATIGSDLLPVCVCASPTEWEGPSCSTPVCSPACNEHAFCTDVVQPPVCDCVPGYENPPTCTAIVPSLSRTPSVSAGPIVVVLPSPSSYPSVSLGASPSATPSPSSLGTGFSCPSMCNGRGSCTATDTCLCSAGWAGSACQFAVCADGTALCSGRGTCDVSVDPHSCVCDAGFGGDNCEVDQRVCPNDCFSSLGHGTCIVRGDNVACSCSPGWEGTQCELEVLPAQLARSGSSGGGKFPVAAIVAIVLVVVACLVVGVIVAVGLVVAWHQRHRFMNRHRARAVPRSARGSAGKNMSLSSADVQSSPDLT